LALLGHGDGKLSGCQRFAPYGKLAGAHGRPGQTREVAGAAQGLFSIRWQSFGLKWDTDALFQSQRNSVYRGNCWLSCNHQTGLSLRLVVRDFNTNA